MNEIINLLNPWWFKHSFKTGIPRIKYIKRLTQSLEHKRAVLLVGSRRVGKTTIFHQLIEQLLETVRRENILYTLMDHPQISSYTIFEIVKEYRRQFALDRNALIYLFFDEIQHVKDWEQEIKALLDTENVKIFLSGSASSQILLKSPYLTGRIEKVEVFPLDFKEFLAFRKIVISETETYKYEKYIDEYLKVGGYPEYVLSGDAAYFSDLINNILYKDIVSLYKIRNPELLRDLLLLLADRTGHQTTYTKLASILSLKNDTVKEYIYYLKNTMLIDELPRYATSRSQRIYGPKKFYITDNGILFHLVGRLQYGSAFEQTLFNHLKQHTKKIGFYYENQKEVDFLVESKDSKQLWEAKYEIREKLEKELERYLEIGKSQKARKIIFVTKSYDGKRTTGGMKIEFVPIWKKLIENKTI